ncbi:competence protein CoiA family protein [Sporolactobacillus sp. Y61]|uniref:Competence protein CoiA family protein n=1 Tax=Sporolactobacillus sp. Y61 TaxID=3160863 RepID=A0AAU8ICC5_9BACL
MISGKSEAMLVALRDNGQVLSLVSSSLSRRELMMMRDRENFSCPVCGSPVRLKLGLQKKWHFSHYAKDQCIVESEPESEIHLTGKSDLFKWTRDNGHQAELEYYLKEIRQRPDIFLPGIQPEAIEYQCSSITETTLSDRTAGYRQLGIRPVWIMGGCRKKKKGSYLSLSGFEPLTMAYNRQDGHPFVSSYFVCYYFPSEKLLCFSGHIHSISKTQFISEEMYMPLQQIRPFHLIRPVLPFHPSSFMEKWVHYKRRQRLHVSAHTTESEMLLRVLAYQMRSNYAYFPAFVGIPHEHYVHLSSPPHLWQMWIYLIMSGNRRLWVTPEYLIHRSGGEKVKRFFRRRQLPLCPQISLKTIIKTYLNQLVFLNAVREKEGAYQLKDEAVRVAHDMDRLLQRDAAVLKALSERPDPSPVP